MDIDQTADPIVSQRTVEFYDKGVWTDGSWAGLKEGMIFRLRELDGTLVDEGTDNEICIAEEDATPQPKPMYHCVRAEPFTNIGMDHPFVRRIKVFRDGEHLGFMKSIDMRAKTLVRKGVTESFDYVEIGPK